ncbi:MAG: amino acid aminotransferase [Planctomycetota bacterium]
MLVLDKIEAAPADPILGLTAAFKEDTREGKINLSVGVYQDEQGRTPLLECVREAEGRLAAETQTKSYLPIPGSPGFRNAVRELVFASTGVEAGRVSFAHTPGGTGGLRVAGDFLKANLSGATLWMSTPTWPNHPNIFGAAGVTTKGYRYFDPATNGLDFEGMLADIGQMPAGDAILLHGCCHNPTGIDPTPEQWSKIAGAVRERGVLPLLDFAYQGFADGVEEDTVGLKAFAGEGAELIVISSFSKNFSLYRERVGGLSIVSADAEGAAAVQSQMNRVIRSNYSNPPAHGAALVECVLTDDALHQQWLGEVAVMRDRINGMRSLLVESLKAEGVPGDYSFITRQRGMFSFSGLTKEQVGRLREEHAIYVVGSGRINVAGLTPDNVGRVAKAIAAVS